MAPRKAGTTGTTSTTKTPKTKKKAAPSTASAATPTVASVAAGGKTTKGKARAQTNATTGPTHDEVARRAYEIWLRKGCPPNSDAENWHQAEQELTNR